MIRPSLSGCCWAVCFSWIAVIIFLFYHYCASQGGFDYKKAIVDTIITVIEENSDAKEAGNNIMIFWHYLLRVVLCVFRCFCHVYHIV